MQLATVLRHQDPVKIVEYCLPIAISAVATTVAVYHVQLGLVLLHPDHAKVVHH